MQVSFTTPTSQRLSGILKKEKYEEPLLVICHGYKSSSKHPALVAIVAGLNARGHTTFTFDFSEGSELNLAQQIDDIRSVTEYFKDYNDIVVLAGSFAALTAVMATTEVTKIKGLVTVNGFFGSGKLGSKYDKPYKAFKLLTAISPRHKKTWRAFTAGFHPENISVPVLIIHSKKDEIVSYEQSKDFFQRVGAPKEFKALSIADHHLTLPGNVKEVTQLVDAWLRKYRLSL